MKLLKNSIVYILVSVFSGALSFLLLPVLTNFLSPSSFGTIELYRSMIAFLQGVMIFGTNTLIFGNCKNDSFLCVFFGSLDIHSLRRSTKLQTSIQDSDELD